MAETVETERATSPSAILLSSSARAWPCLVRSEESWTRNDQPLLRAIEKEGIDIVRAYFESGVAIQREAFRQAARSNKLEILRWLYSLLADAGAAVPKKLDLLTRISLRFSAGFLHQVADPERLSLLQNHVSLARELKQAAGEHQEARQLCSWLDHNVLEPLALWA